MHPHTHPIATHAVPSIWGALEGSSVWHEFSVSWEVKCWPAPKHALICVISDPFVNFAQSLTLRWMNPKKNKKWLQLHMSAQVSTRGWGVSAWSDIIQRSCICISVIAIRMYSPSQQEWWHADSPHEAAFPVVKLAYADPAHLPH